MGRIYRLNEFGVRLTAGSYIISAKDFACVDSGTQIIRNAEAKATEIIDEAKVVFENQKVRGYEEGFRSAQLDAIERLMSEQKMFDRGLASLEKDLARLVHSCVERLVGEIEDHSKTEALVRDLLSKMRREKRIELSAAPDAVRYLKAHLERIRAEYPEIQVIDLIEDEHLETDRIIVESPLGRIDGNLKDRLNDLAQILSDGRLHINSTRSSGTQQSEKISDSTDLSDLVEELTSVKDDSKDYTFIDQCGETVVDLEEESPEDASLGTKAEIEAEEDEAEEDVDDE